jgi:hypothetical protein
LYFITKEVISIKNLFRNKIFIRILVIILILVVGAFSFLFYKESKSGNLKAKSNISEIQKIDEEISNEELSEIEDSEYYPIEKIYDIIHRMSNTKIVAEDNQIWGMIEMEPEYIASLKSLIEKVDYKDRDYMLEVLTRWENNDFSQAVDEHNYFWRKLGGTVGKAISLKE